MIRKLVGFDGRQFDEVDQVKLRRAASALLEQVTPLLDDELADAYELRQRLLPALEAAINGWIIKPLREEHDFIGGLFLRQSIENELPILASQFAPAFARFSVAVRAVPTESLTILIKDGKRVAWVDFEEVGDWPGNGKQFK